MARGIIIMAGITLRRVAGTRRRRGMSPLVGCVKRGEGQPALVVFSGGTAFNQVAGLMRVVTERVSHVLPVSDDGGSTAEIVRVLGGPAVGDIRSRCLRLSDASTAESRAVRDVLAHRLHPLDCASAKAEWIEILEGDSRLWDGVSKPYKHTIRSFLVHFQTQLLRMSGDTSEKFNYANGSVGNFFFAGARTFFRSLDAAIFLYSRVSGIPSESYVLPAIRTNDRLLLGAELEDCTLIRGQNAISHPPHNRKGGGCGANAGGNLVVEKGGRWERLKAPIRRVLYMSTEGGSQHEVFPLVNPDVTGRIREADGLIFGMGSLYTSICPALILSGVGEAVAERSVPKLLLLNGSEDRETSGMSAVDVVLAIQQSLNRSWATYAHLPARADLVEAENGKHLGEKSLREEEITSLEVPVSSYITHLLYPSGCGHSVDVDELNKLGIATITKVKSTVDAEGKVRFDCEALVSAISEALSSKPRFAAQLS